jgi:hypothetical protein
MVPIPQGIVVVGRMEGAGVVSKYVPPTEIPEGAPDLSAIPGREISGDCRRCEARPAETWWVADGGTWAWVHGAGVLWCHRCCAEMRLAYARKFAAQIPELERDLAELGGPTGLPTSKDPT